MGFAVPVVLIQGAADTIVPISQARAMASAREVLIEDAGHFDLIHPGTPAFPALIEILEDLLKP